MRSTHTCLFVLQKNPLDAEVCCIERKVEMGKQI